MAITRAQQAKQMLQNGGMLVSPSEDGKRPGYRGDAAYRSYSAQSTGSQRGTATKSEIGGGKAQPFDAPLKNDPRVPQSVKDSKGGITKAQSDAAKDFKESLKDRIEQNVDTSITFPFKSEIKDILQTDDPKQTLKNRAEMFKTATIDSALQQLNLPIDVLHFSQISVKFFKYSFAKPILVIAVFFIDDNSKLVTSLFS